MRTPDNNQSLVTHETIAQAILFFRGQKVILDEDLASLYGVETRILVRNVKRNLERFPHDFMFQLTQDEFGLLTQRRQHPDGRLVELEKNYDDRFRAVIQAIQALMETKSKTQPIGFIKD
jgi:hypothetical protein